MWNWYMKNQSQFNENSPDPRLGMGNFKEISNILGETWVILSMGHNPKYHVKSLGLKVIWE